MRKKLFPSEFLIVFPHFKYPSYAHRRRSYIQLDIFRFADTTKLTKCDLFNLMIVIVEQPSLKLTL